MDSKLAKALNDYYYQFHVDFPFGYQVDDEDEMLRDIKQCLRKNVDAETLFPEKYGKCEGKLF